MIVEPLTLNQTGFQTVVPLSDSRIPATNSRAPHFNLFLFASVAYGNRERWYLAGGSG